MDCDLQLTANARERQVPRSGEDMPGRHLDACFLLWFAYSLSCAVGLLLHCDRVPFTLLSACKFPAAFAIQPITAKEL